MNEEIWKLLYIKELVNFRCDNGTLCYLCVKVDSSYLLKTHIHEKTWIIWLGVCFKIIQWEVKRMSGVEMR